MLSAFHLLGVHSFLVLAFGVLLVIAVLHVSVASGPSAMTDSNGWTSDLFYDRSAARTPRGAVAPLLPLWGTSSSQLADRKPLHRSQKTQKLEFVGKYASLRRSLDYTYHAHYPTSRQLFQDSIIDAILNETNIIDEDGNTCTGTDRPWIVYTAGAMGAGKSYTIRQLAANQRFPLHSFVRVDYDAVRKHLPEFQLYIQQSPEHAGEWTRKEAGYIAELATQAALQRSHNVLVDGSLRDSTWFKKYFSQLRRHHPHLRIGILHVTAPPDAVFQRAEDRSKITGRVVPRSTLEQALHQVPKSVRELAPLSDFFCEIHNPPKSEEVQIATEGLNWEQFRRIWAQKCPKEEHRRKST